MPSLTVTSQLAKARPIATRLCALVAPVAAAVVLLSGCGGSDSSPPAASDASGSGSPTAAVISAAPSASIPAGGLCSVVTAAQISAALGAPVTTEVGPFDACEFSQENLRDVSGALGTTPLEEGAGGYEGYRSGSASALQKSTSEDLSGIGEAAFVAIGTFPGGESLQAAAGAKVGDIVVTVNLSQGVGRTKAEMIALSKKLLTLAVDAL